MSQYSRIGLRPSFYRPHKYFTDPHGEEAAQITHDMLHLCIL